MIKLVAFPMPSPKRPKTIDDVIRFILANAPPEGSQIRKNPFTGRRFFYELVDGAIRELHAQGRFLDLEAYDISNTTGIWNDESGRNYELARRATKALLTKLQEDQHDKTLAELITEITANTFHKPINKYKTILGGMLYSVYENSPYNALKNLIDIDPELAEFRDLEPYDMECAPQYTWINQDGSKNHELVQRATKVLLTKLQEDQPDKTLAEILPTITKETFDKKPINKYGTTLGGMLTSVPGYNGSPYSALKDAIDVYPEFAEFRDFQPYDMKRAPIGTWQGEEGKTRARHATKQLIKKIQEEHPDKKLEEMFPMITLETFKKYPINKYQTTLGGMLAKVPSYNHSPYIVLKDLIDADSELEQFRDFQPYDMKTAPMETWINKDGSKNYKLARHTTKTLLNKLQKDHPHKAFAELITEITANTFQKYPINKYGTTLATMLSAVHEGSPYAALKNLAEHDPEYTIFLPVIETMTHRAA